MQHDRQPSHRHPRELAALPLAEVADRVTRSLVQRIALQPLEGLAQLKTVTEGGIHTAGNSSQISDGSAAVLWTTAEKAKEYGLKPRARVIQDVVVGTDPHFLLDGPVDATNEILRKTGRSLADIDLVEINEAFFRACRVAGMGAVSIQMGSSPRTDRWCTRARGVSPCSRAAASLAISIAAAPSEI